MAVAYSLLLSDEPSVQQVQLAYIKQAGIAGLALQVLQLQPVLTALDEALKLPVVALAMPALKCLSPEQYKIFKRTLLLLIRADKQMDLFEWCVYQLLRHYLDGEFGIASQGQRSYKKLQQVQRECQQVLSVLARSGSDSTAGFKRGMQVLGLPELPLLGEQDCGLDEFSRAVNSLANCLPLLKPVILKALVECVRHDGVVAPAEREVLLAIAAVMDCPLPRFNMDRL
jgi:hypothetical protein